MRLAVVSDTHNRYARMEEVLHIIKDQGADLILHCGDIEDAEMVELFPSHTHFVFGNCDTDRQELREAIKNIGATLHEPFGNLTVGGVDLAWIHGDDRRLLGEVENSAAFAYLFHGHTHIAREHRTGPTRVINPGALHRVETKTFILLDPVTGVVESFAVP